ncbi:MAG: type II toxin-antitoxin system RelB/DinJ family antitoxin [Emcibacteraceae bacterium]|nr:type II toxin-antitoxin system RelB/DinJ family antitoxin [Emcibacteraceae bacterium]
MLHNIIYLSPKLKAQAESVFSQMGMNTADAIRMFLQQTVNDGGLSFQPHTKTIAAFSEVEDNQSTEVSLDDLRREMEL